MSHIVKNSLYTDSLENKEMQYLGELCLKIEILFRSNLLILINTLILKTYVSKKINTE